MKARVIVTGTGRAGTTFAMQLFTLCGIDTGYDRDRVIGMDRAGLERHPRPTSTPEEIAALPYVVKDPQICLHLRALVERKVLRIERLIVPVRDLTDAAASRISAGLAWVPDRRRPEVHTPRGQPTLERQREKLAEYLGDLVAAATVLGIPLTLIPFAELVGAPTALYMRLLPLLPLGPFERFTDAHRTLRDHHRNKTR